MWWVGGWVGGWPVRLYGQLPRSSYCYCYLVDLGAWQFIIYHYFLPLSLIFLLSSSGSATISFLGWNWKIRLIFLFYCQWIYLLYLLVVEEVHEDLHDARKDQHAGADDQEVVDVVKWPILLFLGSCKHLEEGMSGSNLEAWNCVRAEFIHLSFFLM